MADDDEDDYLSDKFLAAAPAPAPSGTKTYSQRRQDAARRGERLQQTSRLKSRREREAEAREAGLSKTLFERAEEDAAAAGAGAGTSKALAMMLRMGFKPGQALGAADADAEDGAPPAAPPAPVQLADDGDTTPPAPGLGVAPPAVAEGARPASRKPQHRTEPLPLNEWTGRKGIGLGKRALSPSAVESMAKTAKHTEAADVDTFRARAREQYVEKRAEGRLVVAQRTCVTQDTQAGMLFNVLWMNPEAPESIPRPLLDALEDDAYTLAPLAVRQRALEDVQARLRTDMQADALQPLAPLDDVDADTGKATLKPSPSALGSEQDFDEETVERAREFLRQNAPERLETLLSYLRSKYAYCFWCGTQYESAEELAASCPGASEEEHD